MAAQDLLILALDALVKTTLLLGLAAGAAFLLRKRSAALRHLAWSTALAGALALPLAASLAPEWTAPLPLPLLREATPAPAAAAAPAASLAPIPAQALPELEARAVTVDKLPPMQPVAAGALAEPHARSSGLDPLALALGLWAAGTALLFGWTMRAHLRARGLVRRARELDDPELTELLAAAPGGRRVRLLESAEIDVPLATGLLRPALIVPAGFDEWSPERRRVVLLHELAHVQRGDCLAQLFGRLAVAAWWFHPLAWLALARLRREAEQAADDRVIEAGARPSEYAAHLLAVVRTLTGRSSALAGLSMAGSSVERRLLALLDPSRSRGRLSPAGLVIGTVLVAGLVTGLGGLRADASPSEHKAAAGHGDHAFGDHHPGHDHALGDWMSTLVDNSGPAKAHEALQRLVGGNEGSRAFSDAMKHHDRGEYEESARGFEQAFDLGHSPGTSAFNAACALSRLGRESRALDWLDIAFENGFTRVGLLDTDADLENLRDEPRFERLRGEVKEKIASGEYRDQLVREKTRRSLEELRASGSEDGGEWYQAGYAAHRIQDWAGAEEAWRRAAELGHSPGNSHYNLACALARQGKERAALDELETAILLGFDDPSNLAKDDDLDSLRGRPRFSRATEMLAALQMPGPLNDLDHVREHRADWESFTARTGEIARRHPESALAWYRHGIGLLRTERWDESAAAFRKASEAGWSESTCLYNEACALAGAGRNAEALDALEKAVEGGAGAGTGLAKDPDLRSLRDEPRFRALVEEHGGILDQLHEAIRQRVY